MTDRKDHRDRLIDVLLSEKEGGEAPPDLKARILARAAKRPPVAWLPVAAAAAVLLAISAWILLTPPPEPSPVTPASPAEEKVIYRPLPEGARDFQGMIVGLLLDVDDQGVVVRVEKVVPARTGRSLDPTCIIGRKLHVRIAPGRTGRGLRDKLQAVRGREVRATLNVWTERDEAMFLQNLRAGDHTGGDR